MQMQSECLCVCVQRRMCRWSTSTRRCSTSSTPGGWAASCPTCAKCIAVRTKSISCHLVCLISHHISRSHSKHSTDSISIRFKFPHLILFSFELVCAEAIDERESLLRARNPKRGTAVHCTVEQQWRFYCTIHCSTLHLQYMCYST